MRKPININYDGGWPGPTKSRPKVDEDIENKADLKEDTKVFKPSEETDGE